MTSERTPLDGSPSRRGRLLEAQARLAHHLLRSTGEANGVVAPFGAYLALSMLAQGARSHTALAFDQALGLSGAERASEVADLRGELARYDGDPTLAAAATLPDRPLLHLASRLAFTDQLDLNLDFSDSLTRTFGSVTERVDFTTPQGADALNTWVRQHSGGLVERSAVLPSRDLALVIQDVAVLAARWRQPFMTALTTDRPFYPGARGKRSIQVPTMVGSSTSWQVAEREGWLGVRLPYSEGFVADVLLPPADGSDPAQIEPFLIEELRSALDTVSTTRSAPRRVEVYLPRINLAPPPLDLRAGITALGLAQLFDRPDLSGITSTIPVEVSQATAQTRLVMAEAGTVAAAVTEIAMRARGVVPAETVQVQVNRPYLVRIGHVATGLTLFLAVVRDPSAQ